MLQSTHGLTYSDYLEARYQFIKAVENVESRPYVDSVGQVTIGMGFNIEGNDGLLTLLLRDGLHVENDSSIPIETDPASGQSYRQMIIVEIISSNYTSASDTAALQTRLNQIMYDRWINNGSPAGVPNTFEIPVDDLTLRPLFDVAAEEYEGILNQFLVDSSYNNGASVVTGNEVDGIEELAVSYERLALFSFAYNDSRNGSNPLLGPSNNLAQALSSGDRATAWYEMRFQSRGGVASFDSRRYTESQLFGLYNNVDNIPVEEAQSVWSMYTANLSTIRAVAEVAEIKTIIDSAVQRIESVNSSDATRQTISTLGQILTPIKEFVFTQYLDQDAINNGYLQHQEIDKITGDVVLGHSTEQVSDGGQFFQPVYRTAYNISPTTDSAVVNNPHVSGVNDLIIKLDGQQGAIQGLYGDDILIGANTNDVIYGGYYDETTRRNNHSRNSLHNGNDILIGNGGADELYGQFGDDTLVGGVGNDRLEGGEGSDRLAGGVGNDRYIYKEGDGFDTIIEVDTGNKLIIDGSSVVGIRTLGHGGIYEQVDGSGNVVAGRKFVVASEGLYVIFDNNNEDRIFIKDWSEENNTFDFVVTNLTDEASIVDAIMPNVPLFELTDEIYPEPADPDPWLEYDIYYSPSEFGVLRIDGVPNGGISSQVVGVGVRDGFGVGLLNSRSAYGNALLSPSWNIPSDVRGFYLDADSWELFNESEHDFYHEFPLYGGIEAEFVRGRDGQGQADLIETFASHSIVLEGNGDGQIFIRNHVGVDPSSSIPHTNISNYIDGGDGIEVIYADPHIWEEGTPSARPGDTIYAGENNFGTKYLLNGDHIFAGSGNDNITLGRSPVYSFLLAGDGSDEITGGVSSDVVFSDNILTATEFEGVYLPRTQAFASDDSGLSHFHVFLAGARGDFSYNDVISTHDGDDFVEAGIGDDTIFGGDGADILIGDRLLSASDYVFGDKVYTNFTQLTGIFNSLNSDDHGDDVIFGGRGDDYIYGGGKDDLLYGDEGHDRIYGGEGNDRIYGGDEGDHIYGEGGEDTITGDKGNDVLDGGDGDDSYIFNLGDGLDRINDSSIDTITINADVKVEFEIGNAVIKYGISDELSLSHSSFAGAQLAIRYDPLLSPGYYRSTGPIETSVASVGSNGDDVTLSSSLVENTVAVVLADGSDVVTVDSNTSATFFGGRGDDIFNIDSLGSYRLVGGQGSDRYVFVDPSVSQTLNVNVGDTDHEDVVVLSDLAVDDISFSRESDDLVIETNVGGVISLINYYSLTELNRVENVEFEDGIVWGHEQFGFDTSVLTPELLTAPSNIRVADGEYLAVDISRSTFQDVGDNPLVYRVSSADGSQLPEWVTFDEATLTLHVTSQNVAEGAYDFRLTGANLLGVEASDRFTIFVDEENMAPVATADAFSTATNAIELSFNDLLQNDYDDDTLLGDSFTLTGAGASSDHVVNIDEEAKTLTFVADSLSSFESFTYQITDSQGETGLGLVRVRFLENNNAPEPIERIASQVINEGDGLSISLNENLFYDDEDDPLTYSAALSDGSALPSWLSFNESTLSFTGSTSVGVGHAGTFSVRVTANDGLGGLGHQDFAIRVDYVNEGPSAIDDNYTVTLNEGLEIFPSDLLANDTDPNLYAGDRLSFVSIGDAVNGEAVFDRGRIHFQPDIDFIGDAFFDYIVRDLDAVEDTARVTITVTSSNVAPIVEDTLHDWFVDPDTGVYYGPVGLPGYTDFADRQIDPNATNLSPDDFVDPNGDTLSYSASLADGRALPNWLQIDSATGSLSGTPNTSEPQEFNIQITATDSHGASVSQTFYLTSVRVDYLQNLLPESDFSSVQFGGREQVEIDTQPFGVFIGSRGNDYFYDRGDGGPTLLYGGFGHDSLSAAPGGSFLFAVDGTDVLFGASGNDELHAGLGQNVRLRGFNGDDKYFVGSAQSAIVNNIGSGVVGSNGFDRVIFDNGVGAGDISIDRNAEDLLLTNVNGNTVTLKAFFAAADSYEISIDAVEQIEFSDGTQLSQQDILVAFEDRPIAERRNTAPVVITPVEDQFVTEGNAFNLSVFDDVFDDADDDALTISITQSDGSEIPQWLSFSERYRFISGTPTDSDLDELSLVFTADDGNGGTVSDSFTINAAVVDAQSFAQGDELVTDEDTAVVISASTLLANDSESPSDLTITSVTNAVNGQVSWDEASQEVVFIPAQNFTGEASFDYEIADGLNRASSATVTLTIESQNDTPVAQNDSAVVQQDTNIVFSVSELLANDGDVDTDDSLALQEVFNAQNGQVVFDELKQTVTFIPEANYFGEAQFDYSIVDRAGLAATATVFVDVTENTAIDQGVTLVNSTGLMLNFYAGLNHTTRDAASIPQALSQSNVSSSQTITGGLSDPITMSRGDAYLLSGLIYLDASSTYEFAGFRDDSLRIEIGGHTLISTTGDSYGEFGPGKNLESGEYTPPENGLYTLNIYVNNVSGRGSFSVDVIVDGELKELSASNFGLYTSIDDLSQIDDALTDFVTTSALGGYIPLHSTNTEPVAQADDVHTFADESIVIDVQNLLANDSDVNTQDELSVESITNFVNGSAQYDDQNGGILFVPTTGFAGTASFDYIVSDNEGGRDTATVSVDVRPQPLNVSLPESTGLLLDYYDNLNHRNRDASTIENAIGNLSSGFSSAVLDGLSSLMTMRAGDALSLTGLIYLEQGKRYEFSGYHDDSLRIELGGKTLVSTTGDSFGEFGPEKNLEGGSFTPTLNGLYTLETYVNNVSGRGGFSLDIIVDGEVQPLSASNFEVYTSSNDLSAISSELGDFYASSENTSGGYFHINSIDDEGTEPSNEIIEGAINKLVSSMATFDAQNDAQIISGDENQQIQPTVLVAPPQF